MLSFITLFKRVSSDMGLDQTTVQYCTSRIKREGAKFWTITLPKLSARVLVALEIGNFRTALEMQPAFTAVAWKGRSLRYFRSLLDQIFCPKTGNVLPNPSAIAIRSLRQVCDYVYKLSFGFDTRSLELANQKYLATQRAAITYSSNPKWFDQLRKDAETHYPALFRAHAHDILARGPRFGPGAVNSPAELWSSNFAVAKLMPTSVVGSHDVASEPYKGYFKPFRSRFTRRTLKRVADGRTAKVLYVPKDSRGPRVISKEPPFVLQSQMAYFDWLADALNRVTAGRINFRDQSLNRRLAAESSISRTNVTADMDDGSNRVYFSLVRYIFRNAPGISWFFKNARSESFSLPSPSGGCGITGKQHSLAGMGSGLTFPTMAFLIHHSICSHISRVKKLPYKAVSRRVYVYGDDTVYPSEWHDEAVFALEQSGLKINKNKTFVNSNFRESCGGDFFAGKDVTPLRLTLRSLQLPPLKGESVLSDEMLFGSLKATRQHLRTGYSPIRLQKANLIASLFSHVNNLYEAGLFATASYVQHVLLGLLPKYNSLPFVGPGSPIIGIVTDDRAKILTQPGVVSADGGHLALNGYTITSVESSADGLCPYKFLAKKLKLLETSDDVRTKPFGVYDEPRMQKVVYRQFSMVSVLGTLPA